MDLRSGKSFRLRYRPFPSHNAALSEIRRKRLPGYGGLRYNLRTNLGREAAVIRFFFLSILVLASAAQAVVVNRLNGGVSVVYVDFSLGGNAVPLELVRTYSSLTALNEQSGWSGVFGWGWNSPIETTLITTPDKQVLLRDGNSGNTVIFKSEKEDPKAKEFFFNEVKRAYFERTKEKTFSKAELSKMALPEKILNRLKTDPQFRAEMASKYGIKGAIPKGELLVSIEYGYQTLQFKNNQWVREKDGITQYFDAQGRLVRSEDRSGFGFNYLYSAGTKNQVDEIHDKNKTVSLKLKWRQDRVAEVVDNRNRKSRYAYDSSGNLVQVTDSNSQTYIYRYENKKFPHLLTKIEYISESDARKRVARELVYDDNGLVILHRDKDGSETTYTYGKSASDPENNFWTRSTRKNPAGAAEEIYDEYTIRSRPDGTKYLYKQDNRQGTTSTSILYTACCGKPQQVTRNGEVTQYKYYENGLLKEKLSPKENLQIEYDPRWKKVSKVNQGKSVSKYEYDNQGNLIRASNNQNQKIALKYDRSGRILDMKDASGREISFQYGGNGKPSVISEKGIGTIRIVYDTDGRIKKAETILDPKTKKGAETRSQEVVRRVMQGFQQLLDILRPAGESLTNIAGV